MIVIINLIILKQQFSDVREVLIKLHTMWMWFLITSLVHNVCLIGKSDTAMYSNQFSTLYIMIVIQKWQKVVW